MTQAPTPGPLSDAERYEQAKRDFNRMRDDGSLPECDGCDASHRCMGVGNVCNPTAPVEASGSERERMVETIKAAMKDAWEDHASDTGCWPADIKRVSARGPLRLMFTPLIWAQMTAELAADAILNLRPQPSGETREQVARLIDPKGWEVRDSQYRDIKGSTMHDRDRPLAFANADYYTRDSLAKADAILALIRPAPVASGGQQGEDEIAFLLDRLADFENDINERDWYGHVAPAIARVKAALSTTPAADADRVRSVACLTRYSPLSTGNNKAMMQEDEAGLYVLRKQALAALKSTAAKEGGGPHQRWGILNHLGGFWTPENFDTERQATAFLDRWKRDNPKMDLSKHKVIPVLVTMTAAPTGEPK